MSLIKPRPNGESSSTATATPPHVLTGDTFNAGGTRKTGTMPDKAGNSLEPDSAIRQVNNIFVKPVEGYYTNGSNIVLTEIRLSSIGYYDTSGGNATAGQVLAGKYFYNSAGLGTGTMVDRSTNTVNPGSLNKSGTTILIHPQNGYYTTGASISLTQTALNGQGYYDVTGDTAVAGDMIAGKTAHSSGGAITGTLVNQIGDGGNGHTDMSSKSSNARTSGSNIVFPILPGVYLTNANAPGVERDTPMGYMSVPNLTPENIKAGVTVIDIVGTAQEGYQASVTKPSGATSYNNLSLMDGNNLMSLGLSCLFGLSSDNSGWKPTSGLQYVVYGNFLYYTIFKTTGITSYGGKTLRQIMGKINLANGSSSYPTYEVIDDLILTNSKYWVLAHPDLKTAVPTTTTDLVYYVHWFK